MVIMMQAVGRIVITELLEIFSRTTEVHDRIKMINRPSYGITYTVSGRIIYYHNDKRFVSDDKHIILIPRGATYEYDCAEPGEFAIMNFRCTDDFQTDEFIRLPLKDAGEFLRGHTELARLHCSVDPFDNMRSLMLAYRILLQLFDSAPESSIHPKLRPALELIERDFADPELNSLRLADSAGVSEVYLRKLFCRYYGVPPMRYLQQFRLNKSMIGLLQSSVSISEIALECGYTNPYHFCRAFKQRTGMTPGEYRRLKSE